MRQKTREYPDRLALIAKAEGENSTELSTDKLALQAADGVEHLVQSLGLAKKLSDYGITKKDLPSIARDASSPEEYAATLKVLERIL
jgi:alcohol dehydrogenase class IV